MKNFQAYLWWPSLVKPQVNTFFTLTPFFPDDSDTRQPRYQVPVDGAGAGARSDLGTEQKMRPTYFLSAPGPATGPTLFVGLFYLRLAPAPTLPIAAGHTLYTRTHHLIRTIYVKMKKNETFFIRMERKHSAARADTVLRTRAQQSK